MTKKVEDMMDKIEDVLVNLDDEELVCAWNEYAKETGDSQVHPMCDLEEVFEDFEPEDWINLGNCGFDTTDRWFIDEESFSDPQYTLLLYVLERYCIYNDEDLGIYKIRQILEEEI